MKAIVLGAGVVGVTTAYFLARAGNEVTVLERNPNSAQGCSYANGCQLSYSHTDSLIPRSSLLQLAKAVIKPSSFFSISDFSKKSLGWILESLSNTSEKRLRETNERLFAIASYSRELMAEILANEEFPNFHYKNEGILHFYRSQKFFEAAVREAEIQNIIGTRAQILTPQECIDREPTLVKSFDNKKLVGGIFYPLDASGDCRLFTQKLAEICQQKYGVTFHYQTEVRNILTNYKKITGINTNRGVLTADSYIYALGTGGDSLLQGIRVNTKIYPLRGYSLSIGTDPNFIAPRIALTDPENRIFYSRVGNIFRVSGTAEMSGNRNLKNKKLINFLQEAVKSTFTDFGDTNKMYDWSDARPYRPNGMPLICKVKKYKNLFLNTGHGSIGWTLATASGKIISDLVFERKSREFDFLQTEGDKI